MTAPGHPPVFPAPGIQISNPWTHLSDRVWPSSGWSNQVGRGRRGQPAFRKAFHRQKCQLMVQLSGRLHPSLGQAPPHAILKERRVPNFLSHSERPRHCRNSQGAALVSANLQQGNYNLDPATCDQPQQSPARAWISMDTN